MPVAVAHDFLQETENGLILTLYLSRLSEVEFASDLGAFNDPEADTLVLSYIHEKYPRMPFSKLRIVDGDSNVYTVPYMTFLAVANKPYKPFEVLDEMNRVAEERPTSFRP
jgi:hypothetical protein